MRVEDDFIIFDHLIDANPKSLQYGQLIKMPLENASEDFIENLQQIRDGAARSGAHIRRVFAQSRLMR